MGITHAHTATGTDVGNGEVHKAEWNADHISHQPFDAGTSFPGSPSTDDLYFRTDHGILYFYTGSAWRALGVTPADTPPATASAEDDEFAAGSLDAKWTHTGGGSLSFDGSRMCILHAASATDEAFWQAYVPGAGVAFTITAKFTGFTPVEATDFIGIQVQDGSGTAIAGCDFRYDGARKFNKDSPGGASATTLQDVTGPIHLRISRDASNNYLWSISFDGSAWISPVAASSSSTTVGRIAFRFGQTQTRAYKAVCIDWFRRT